jgi:hypothetical protein
MSVKTVEIYPDNGHWTVRVTESADISTRSFEFEDFAKAWAAGQAARLRVRQRGCGSR